MENKMSDEEKQEPKFISRIEDALAILRDCYNKIFMDDYKIWTRKTAIYPKDKVLEYVTLGLCGECGEIANKIKKVIRDDDGVITEEKKNQLKGELGDIYYYLARLSDELGLDINTILHENIKKLEDRKERGVLGGSGDNR
jgi:NTP pyrophosphatase (non-canonical NTP hydrolase)